MVITLDEKAVAAELNCLRIELNAKPDLMSKFLNNTGSLVIVVDMINGFCNTGAIASPRCQAIVPKIKGFLSQVPQARKIFARDCHSENAAEFKWFTSHCTDETQSALVDDLKEFKGMDLPKNSTNAFFNLIKKIPDPGFYTNIAIVGVCTDICVMQLALTLRAYLNETNSETNVIVFTDLVETYGTNLHNPDLMNMFSLKLMEQAGVQLFKRLI